MSNTEFDGIGALRMVLAKLPETDNSETRDTLGALSGLSEKELRAYQFSDDEIDALTDLMMEHFAVDGFVADTLIDFITPKG